MRKKLLLLSSLFSVCALTNCSIFSQHEHTFKEEWSVDALSHWHDASCEHTELSSNRGSHVDANEDGICDICEYQIGHEHTYSEDWSNNETHHWHAATCSHTDKKDDYGYHTFNSAGVCTECGYTPEQLHPVITKTTWKQGNNIGYITTNTWDDDFSYVISSNTDSIMESNIYLGFDENGNTISEGDVVEGNFVQSIGYTYENDLQTSKVYYRNGNIDAREVYEYNQDKKPLCNKYYNVEEDVETLWKKVDFEYSDTYWKEITLEYNDQGEVSDYTEHKWTIVMEGENRKEICQRCYEVNGEYSNIGYLVYNSLGQVVETQDKDYSGGETHLSYEYITYTEDGNLSTIINRHENDYGEKIVYTYDENSFMVKREIFGYNDNTSEYDILVGGYDYVTDSRGTIIGIDNYTIENNQKVSLVSIEYEIKYLPIEFKISYYDFLAETKGTYNSFEIELLAIIG